MKKLLLLLLCLPMIGFGQEWEQKLLNPSVGGDVQQTADGGYIITGNSYELNWNNTVYLLKVNNNGIQQWVKYFHIGSGTSQNGDGTGGGNSVQQSTDGGYIIGGEYSLNDSVDSGFLIKTDGSGNLGWETLFYDTPIIDVLETSDGGFVAVSAINSTMIKTDINGNYQWSIQINHFCFSIIQTSDGGYVVCGYEGGNNINNANADRVGSITKIGNNGSILWYHILGDYQNTTSAVLQDIQQTSDGGYILTGGMNYYIPNVQDEDNLWLIKLDSFGYFEWEETFNGLSNELSDGYSIDKTSDGGYIMTGARTDDYDGNSKVLLIKTDGQGNLEWERTFGGTVGMTDIAYGYSVQQTTDDGYIITGQIIDLINNKYETYLIKTNSQGNITSTLNIPINPNRKIDKIVDVLGRETKLQPNTPFIERYDDGTVEKKIILE
jgi:hypothetical protein